MTLSIGLPLVPKIRSIRPFPQHFLQTHIMAKLLSCSSNSAALKAVLQSNRQRILANFLCKLIHHGLDCEVHLRRAEPAHGTRIVVVRIDGIYISLDVLAIVRAGCLHNRSPRDKRAHRSIRSAIRNAADLHRRNASVFLHSPFVVHDVRMALVAFEH